MDIEQVKLLYDYSKFHIGLYSALIVALIGLAKVGGRAAIEGPGRVCVYVTAGLFLLAAMAGGTIASTISQNSAAVVNNEEIGPFRFRRYTALKWAAIEHSLFWLGVGVAVIGLLWQPISHLLEKWF